MSHSANDELTHHAMLVVWGQYAQSVGLIQEVEGAPLRQKTVTHRPQTKILEFLVAMLAGLEHLKDLLRFTNVSLFAGRALQLERCWATQLPLPFAESSCLRP